MPEPHVIYGFTAGEVSPEFFGRTDLTKYGLGVAEALNWFVDYKGGMFTRQGSQFVAPIPSSDANNRLIRFRAQGSDFTLLFGDGYMRPIRDGGYVLDTPLAALAVTYGSPTTIQTTAPHSLTTNDIVYLSYFLDTVEFNGKYYLITVTAPDTFTLQAFDGTDIDSTAYTTPFISGTITPAVTVPMPYAAEDITELRGEQRFTDLYLTLRGYVRRKLTYIADNDWQLVELAAGSTVPEPVNLTGVTDVIGEAGTIYAVTAVGRDGGESLSSRFFFMRNILNFTLEENGVRLNWDSVTNALYYNVYRSAVLADDDDLSYAMEVGYLGRANATQFTDSNIVPDFTKVPPTGRDPFANESVTYIEVTAGGAGYTEASSLTVIGAGATGTGFRGYPAVDTTGAIIGVVIVNGGENYASPIAVTASIGAGATFEATASPISGNDPSVFKIFQQRGVYAGTDNLPMTIEGSRPGELNNFDISSTINAGDSYSYTLDEQSVTPIKHLVALRSGLLAFTDSTIEQLSASEGKAVTPLSALAETQAYKGAGDAEPVTVELDIIFAQEVGGNVFAMTFTQYTNTYQLQDLSVLASHLFGKGKSLTSMTYAAEPHKLIYCIREDGTRLLFTYLREQEVFGWTRDETKGLYKDNVAVIEESSWTTYQVVERRLVTSTTPLRFVERLRISSPKFVEDTWAVDCGLSLQLTYPDTTCIQSSSGDLDFLTFGASVNGEISAGDIIYVNGGKVEVLSFTSPTFATVKIIRDYAEYQNEDPAREGLLAPSGAWCYGTPTTVVSGLSHLEGENVSVLADGTAILEVPVINGTVTLPLPSTKVVIGLPYECRMKTLNVLSNQVQLDGHYRDVLGVAVRVYQTRGLTIGDSFSDTDQFSMRDRTDEEWGEPINLRNDVSWHYVNTGWDREGAIYFVQKYPLHAAILGYITSVEAGDLG